MQTPIIVVGSTNTDMVIKAARIPRPGETILGGAFLMNAGGKGANQAVAAARLGGRVRFVAKTGNDVFGQESRKGFIEAGIDAGFVFTDPHAPSGVALITVDEKGENSIAVASGANALLSVADVESAAGAFEDEAILLMQLEVPLETVRHAAARAREKGITVILNPAPACSLPQALLRNVSIITPNETEVKLLTGIDITNGATANAAAQVLHAKGVETVIITLGAQGAFVSSGATSFFVPAPKVTAVDTTAAGDVFNGALAVALSEKKELPQAVAFACKAAAISVTRLGAQASAPFRAELAPFFEALTH